MINKPINCPECDAVLHFQGEPGHEELFCTCGYTWREDSLQFSSGIFSQGAVERLRQRGREAREALGSHVDLLDHGLTIEQMQDAIERDDPDAARGFARYLNGVDSPDTRERERADYIEKIKGEDAFLQGIDPGVPTTEETFANFNPSGRDDSVVSALETAKQWVRGTSAGILVLGGAPGVGKTHLAIAASKALVESHHDVAFRTEIDLIAEIQRRFADNSSDRFIQELSEVPWLVIDDLGMAALTSWGEEKLDRLINERWRSAGALRTLITTNVEGNDLPARLASRLRDRTRSVIVNIKASDYRSLTVEERR